MRFAAWIAIGMIVYSSPLALAQDATIDQIKATWSKTMERTKVCRFEWTEVRNESSSASITSLYTLLLRNTDDFRLDRINRHFDRTRGRYITETYTSTWNGKEGRSFFGTDVFDEDVHPTGFQMNKSSDWDTIQVLPLLLAVRPLNAHFSPIATRAYCVSPEVFERNGRTLMELVPQKPVGTKDAAYVYFVDPKRDFCISRITKHWMGQQLWELDIHHERDLRVKAWLPKSWKFTDPTMNEERVVSRADSYFDDALANEQFLFVFPFGTLVSNRVEDSGVVYIALDGEGREVIPKESRRNKIPYLEYLSKALSSEAGAK